MKNKQIEELEFKYLTKYFHFLKFAEDEMLTGFQTKFKIKEDWMSKWNPNEEGKGISDFATGAERIVYSLLNGKGIGQPNSAPIGSDLFFELDDAFIHIDLKTVQTRNIGDYTKNIFVGNNQNSYSGKLKVNGILKDYDEACLPTFYTIKNQKYKKEIKKVCLTYFITILYEEDNLNILNINLLCMPNGKLNSVYKDSVLTAGKIDYKKDDKKRGTHAKSVRFNWSKCDRFKLLKDKPSRIKVIYFDMGMKNEYKSKLSLINTIYTSQI